MSTADAKPPKNPNGRPPRRVSTTNVTFRVWDLLLVRLRLEAARSKRSKNAVVEAALKNYFFDRDEIAKLLADMDRLL